MISFRLQLSGDAEEVGIQICEKALIPCLAPVSERIKPTDKTKFWVGVIGTLSGGMATDMSVVEAEAVLTSVLSVVTQARRDAEKELAAGALH